MSFKISFKSLGGFICILVLSFYTYVPGYDKPAALYWDENFHIASAQRYLNNVFFLEPHPPLGKILISAGEYLFNFNKVNNQFISEEKAENIPEGFSFAGYRLFPVLLGALIAPLIYLIVLQLSGSTLASFLIALAPTFDNAMIVHNRGAMLESSQIFFLLLSVYVYLKASTNQNASLISYCVLAISCACALTVKINSLPILLFPLALLLSKKMYFKWLVGFATTFCVCYLAIWQLHFAIATNIDTNLDSNGYFDVSPKFKTALQNNKSYNPLYLPDGIYESFRFFNRYQQGVPQLNYCKEDENGSSPILWPIGSRTINYRWTQVDNKIQYLYLVPNIISWGFGLCGVLLGFIFIGSRFLRISNLKNLDENLILFSLFYLITWLAPLSMNRVFYLYHYFVPLSFSWIILGCTVVQIKNLGKLSTNTLFFKLSIFLLSVAAIVSVFLYFSPLTYYKPLTKEEFVNREWIPAWDLRCHNCPSLLPFSSTSNSKDNNYTTNSTWSLKISGLDANYIEQHSGTPIQDGNNLEVLTKSKIQFPLNKHFATFSGTVALGQKVIDANVELKIILDGKILWSSLINSQTKNEAEFNLSINNGTVLTLVAQMTPSDANPSGIIWKNLALIRN